MKDYPLTQRQMMLPPDKLAYELGLIPTPQEIENSKKMNYFLLGGLCVISIGVIVYFLYQLQKEKERKTTA